MTYSELESKTRRLANRLSAWGVRKSDAVGIFSYNQPDWIICDLATARLGAIVVPVYHTLPAVTVKYIINDSGMKLLFVQNTSLAELVAGIRSDCPSLEHVVRFDDDDYVQALDNAFDQNEMGAYSTPTVTPNDLASYVYTTGTTGEPKGVMLTHLNILSNAEAAIRRFKVSTGDIFLSFLPLCHLFERTAGHYTHLLAGATIAYVEGLGTIARDAAEVKPTVMIAVPRMLEMAYDKAARTVQAGPLLKRALVFIAVKLLSRRQKLLDENKVPPWWLRLPCVTLDRLVASKFRLIAGGRLRIFVTGGAPLDRHIGSVMRALGFPLMEGYGLTETSPVVASNSLEDTKIGTVGKPLDEVQVRIADHGEILVKGPNVMRGYLNKPEETRLAIDEGEWLHTGDEGKFDHSGHLVISGRIKDLIVTSNGKKIAPAPIEAKIARSKYIDQVVLCGDRRKYIVALVVPARQQIAQFAIENALSASDVPSLFEHPVVRKLIKGTIDDACADLPTYERPKRFALLHDTCTIENGMLTPALKLKRRHVLRTYGHVIEQLYS